jgi:hypothetical protein
MTPKALARLALEMDIRRIDFYRNGKDLCSSFTVDGVNQQ